MISNGAAEHAAQLEAWLKAEMEAVARVRKEAAAAAAAAGAADKQRIADLEETAAAPAELIAQLLQAVAARDAANATAAAAEQGTAQRGAAAARHGITAVGSQRSIGQMAAAAMQSNPGAAAAAAIALSCGCAQQGTTAARDAASLEAQLAAEQQAKRTLACHICIDDGVDAFTALPCGHSLCNGCWSRCESQQQEQGVAVHYCPFCRDRLRTRKTIQLRL